MVPQVPEEPKPADPDAAPVVAVVDVFVAADGCLTLQGLNGVALEVPMTVDGALALARMLVDWACAAGGLRIATPAGRA